MKHTLVIMLLAAALFAVPAGTACASADQVSLRHQTLQEFEQEGGVVEYMGHALGLDGWMLTRKDGTKITAYTTQEGGLVVGQLVNQDGMVETVEQMRALAAKQLGSQSALEGALLPKSSASKAERFYAEVENAAWVRAGAPEAPYLYMFMNVACDHCWDYWRQVEKDVAGGKLQVRLVPFGVSEENRTRGAALLKHETPGRAWTAYIGGDKDSLRPPVPEDKSLYEALKENGELLAKWNINQTPFTIYRRPEDGKITAIFGVPKNMMLLKADLARN